MPKIDVSEKAFHRFAHMTPSVAELVELLPVLKSEVDGHDAATGILKLEFNDTNRPDLWSTAGAGRGLATYHGGKLPDYSGFLSVAGKPKDSGNRKVEVDAGLLKLRPYIAAFAVKGKVDADTLADLIQTQEKLCWNYGRKRKSIAMGVYRSSLITYPVKYLAADPDATRFVPLGLTENLSLREMLKKHPKGVEFGPIVAHLPKFPLLTDAKG